MSVTYVCEPITREEYESQGFNAYCQTSKKMTPKKRRQRTLQAWEAKQALKAKSKKESVK